MKKRLLAGPTSNGGGMFSTGDLLPQQSGSASIGVGTNGLGNFTTNIKPYAQIHANSGVLYAITGSSGVVRYTTGLGSISAGVGGSPQGNYLQPGFEFSYDGGVDFPVKIGGSNSHGVIQSPPASTSKLFILTSGTLHAISQDDIILRAFDDVTINATDDISLSSATIAGSATSAATGVQFVTTNGGKIVLSTSTGSPAGDILLTTSVGSPGSLTGLNFANIFLDGDGITLSAFDQSITLSTDDSNIVLTSADADGRGLGGQIELNAFASSGRLQYRFGPHQAWAQKLTHASTGGPANDGFWPVPHSGQVLEQIVRREKSKSMTIERPALNNDLTWFYTNQAITITEVESVCRGTFDSSGQFAIRYASDRSAAGTELTSTAITCTSRTTGQITTSFAAPNIPADNWVWIGVSGVSGVATSQLNITMHFN